MLILEQQKHQLSALDTVSVIFSGIFSKVMDRSVLNHVTMWDELNYFNRTAVFQNQLSNSAPKTQKGQKTFYFVNV